MLLQLRVCLSIAECFISTTPISSLPKDCSGESGECFHSRERTMPELSETDRAKARALLDELRAKIDEAAAGDEALRFQIRRYIAKRLEFDERGTPTHRKRLKEQKRTSQRGLCASCEEDLPESGAELHRARAIDGYTAENTSLLCPRCHANAEALAKL